MSINLLDRVGPAEGVSVWDRCHVVMPDWSMMSHEMLVVGSGKLRSSVNKVEQKQWNIWVSVEIPLYLQTGGR